MYTEGTDDSLRMCKRNDGQHSQGDDASCYSQDADGSSYTSFAIQSASQHCSSIFMLKTLRAENSAGLYRRY